MIGWAAKEACAVCKVSEQKYNQSVWEAFLKVAALNIADPVKTAIDLAVAHQEIRARLSGQVSLPRSTSASHR